tara:strand:- start:53 stop:517 length:465 start_codon:yes stop_codon:yes gene_type:complete
MSNYGKQWGEYPSDSEFEIQEVEDKSMCACGGEKHYFKHLCTDSCFTENKVVTETVESIVEFCIDTIIESVDKSIEKTEVVEDYYFVTYGMKPIEWKDENGELIGMVYYTNSPETRKMWGDSLTIRYDESDDEFDEYDEGEAADYHRHRQIYMD